MKQSIHSIVREILKRDNIALNALKKGYINSNAYAKRIIKKVQKRAGKEIKINTITVAVNRVRSKADELIIASKGNVKIPKIVNLEVNTPVLLTTFAPSNRLLITIMNLISDPKYQESFVFFQYTNDEVTIAYEPGLVDLISKWNAQVLFEQKVTVLDVEVKKQSDFSRVVKALECNKIYPFVVFKKQSLGGLLAVDNDDLVKVIEMLS